MFKDSIDSLKNTLKELLDNTHLATKETVGELTTKVETLKTTILQKQNESPAFVRPFIKLKTLFKLKKFDILLKDLEAEAVKNAKTNAIDRSIRDLQKKGFVLPVSKERCLEIFTSTLSELKILGCKCAFCFIVADRTHGLLDLLVFSDTGVLSSQNVKLNDAFDLQATLQHKAPSGIPLSQLQDIAGWLHNHGAVNAPILEPKEIEQKLGKLIKSCPHGAYVLHVPNKALTLSRLSPGGKIEHLIINLQKELGLYTIEREGSEIAATRTQFKRRLEQMGTPIRLVINQQVG